MVDLRGQQLQLFEHIGPLVYQVHAEQVEEGGQLLALGIAGQKLTQVGGVLLHELGRADQLRDLRLANAVGRQRG